jgi:ketosteroid isomerase-like protein
VSHQNVELHRRLVEAFNAHVVEASIALSDPSIELHSVMTEPGGAVYHGHDGLRRYLEDLEDAWRDEIRVEPEAFFDLGEHTLLFYVARGRGRQSGAEVEMPYAQVVRWRNGLIVHFRAYAQRDNALQDLGVSEDALEPIGPDAPVPSAYRAKQQ